MIRIISALVLAIVLSVSSDCCAGTNHAPITPCHDARKNQVPITMECVAAAIAEQAFLEDTQHKIKKYLVYPMDHDATHWYFMIELGDKETPPAPGGHAMV